MKRNFLQAKVVIAALVFGFSVLASLVPVSTQHVYAAGETYTYKDSDNITLSGSTIIGGSVNLKRNNIFGASNAFIGGGQLNISATPGKCGFSVNLTLNGDGKSGHTTARGVDEAGGARGCKPAEYAPFDNKNVTITGNAGEEETADQKTVSVIVYLPNEAPQKPETLKLSIKDSTGKEIDSDNSKKVKMNDGSGFSYSHIFTVAPDADYKACVAAPIDKCKDFHKNKHEKQTISFGENSDSRNIEVEIKITGVRSAGETFTLGPVDVTYELDKGGTAQTVKTDKQEVPPVEVGAGAISDYTGTLTANITDVDPGKYKICVLVIDQCKTVDKPEHINLKVTFDAKNKLDAFQGTEDEAKPSCDLGFFALNATFCPLSAGMATAIGQFNKLINEKLTFDFPAFFDTSKEPGASYYKIFLIIRTIALSIILLVGIILVAGEALGFKIVSAYALRAGLPSLLFGAFFIAIAWPAAKEIVLFGNNMGAWGADIITQPFKDANFFQNSGEVTVLGSLAQQGALVAALIFLGPVGALMGVAIIFGAFAVAYVVLTIWGWIYMALIFSLPLWIALGSFKGTRAVALKAVDEGKGLIAVQIGAPAILAIGTVMAAIARKNGGDAAGLAEVIAALLALIAVMALFKSRRGMVGRLSNGASNFNRKFVTGRGMASLNKRGKARMAERADMLKTGRYAPGWTGEAGKKFNNFTRGVYGARNAGYNPAKFKQQFKEAKAQDAIMRSGAIMQSAQWKPILNNDLAMRAAAASSEGAAESDIIQHLTKDGKTSIDDARMQARSAITSLRAAGFHIGEQGLRMAGFKQMAANGSAIPNLESGMESITAIAGNDASARADMVGSLKAAAAARPDTGAASFGSLFNLATKAATGQASAKDFRDVKVEAARNTAAHQLLNAKEGAIKEIGTALSEDMQYHVGEAAKGGEGAAVHRTKANENMVIQNKLMQGGAYAGVTGVAAIYDTTNRAQDSSGLAHPDSSNRAAVQTNIAYGSPTVTGTAPHPTVPGQTIPVSGPNPSYREGSPLNEEARRYQALSGMQQAANQEEHNILTGGGGS